MLAAVTQSGTTLRFADIKLKKDKAIVLAAVTQNGYALEFADIELKKDKEVVLAAITQNGRALYFADFELKNWSLDKMPSEVSPFYLALRSSQRELTSDGISPKCNRPGS
ncbi:MAG: DUF4116 domain-containing protein [Parachlamydiaceae bacterium]|nr:DUF4116 domain-containing protein [Parachlamydiaceae bacterium]